MRIVRVSASMLLDLIGLPDDAHLVGVTYESGASPKTGTLYLILDEPLASPQPAVDNKPRGASDHRKVMD